MFAERRGAQRGRPRILADPQLPSRPDDRTEFLAHEFPQPGQGGLQPPADAAEQGDDVGAEQRQHDPDRAGEREELKATIRRLESELEALRQRPTPSQAPGGAPRLVRHQHGRGHMLENVAGHAAQHEFAQPRMAVGPHHDQVGGAVRGAVQQNVFGPDLA